MCDTVVLYKILESMKLPKSKKSLHVTSIIS